MLASPGTGTSTTCSRDSLVVGLAPFPSRVAATSGRRPAYTAMTSARVSGRASTRFAAGQDVLDVLLGDAGLGPVADQSVSVVPTIQRCPTG